jgi:hypothetical protein
VTAPTLYGPFGGPSREEFAKRYRGTAAYTHDLLPDLPFDVARSCPACKSWQVDYNGVQEETRRINDGVDFVAETLAEHVAECPPMQRCAADALADKYPDLLEPPVPHDPDRPFSSAAGIAEGFRSVGGDGGVLVVEGDPTETACPTVRYGDEWQSVVVDRGEVPALLRELAAASGYRVHVVDELWEHSDPAANDEWTPHLPQLPQARGTSGAVHPLSGGPVECARCGGRIVRREARA